MNAEEVHVDEDLQYHTPPAEPTHAGLQCSCLLGLARPDDQLVITTAQTDSLSTSILR
jgi:hypothetical protein